MNKEIKKWNVEYNHRDGRKGTIEAITEIGDSQSFNYGNGKYVLSNHKGRERRI